MTRREVALPPEFAGLTGKVEYVQQVSAVEYHSSCPKCGTVGHTGKDAPDRFVIRTDGKARGWCRRCGLVLFPDQLDPSLPGPTKEEIATWRAELIERNAAKARSVERERELLQSNAIWERWPNDKDTAGMTYWRNRGIPDSWQSFWQLGFIHGYHFADITSDAAAIPVFGVGREIQQIKYRLLNEAHGRYRYHLTGVAAPSFMCNPDQELGGHVIAIEGEVKSMVTFATLDNSSVSMIGLPGTNPGQNVVDLLAKAERVTLVMDPGAKRDGLRLARQIGIAKTWLLETTVKIDDGIIAQRLTKRDVQLLLRGAIKLNEYVTA
jgi:hypothetical protein